MFIILNDKHDIILFFLPAVHKIDKKKKLSGLYFSFSWIEYRTIPPIAHDFEINN